MTTYTGIMNCMRCSKEIPHPDSRNADYIIAPDFIVKEPREILIALKHNKATRAKQAKMEEVNPDETAKYPDLAIGDTEYDAVEIARIVDARTLTDLVKVIAVVGEKDIQKTGIVCPGCWRPSDFVIWGVHKGV